MIRTMGLREAFGNRIKVLRGERGLTQDALAFRTERAVDTISLIERGINWPNVDTIEKLAVALEVTVSDLFDGLPLSEVPIGNDRIAVAKDVLNRLGEAELELAVVMLKALVQTKR